MNNKMISNEESPHEMEEWNDFRHKHQIEFEIEEEDFAMKYHIVVASSRF